MFCLDRQEPVFNILKIIGAIPMFYFQKLKPIIKSVQQST